MGSSILALPTTGAPDISSLDPYSGVLDTTGGGSSFSFGQGASLLSQIGLNWFTAVTKGVAGPLPTPGIAAGSGAQAASVNAPGLLKSISNLGTTTLLIIAAMILGIFFFKNKRR